MDDFSKKNVIQTESKTVLCAVHGEFVSNAIKIGEKVMLWSPCPQCSQAGIKAADAAKNAKEIEEKQRNLESTMKRTGIPKRYQKKDFSTYVVENDGQEKALAEAMQFAMDFEKHRTAGTFVIFSGLMGTGKSHLATSIARHVMSDHTALYISAIDAVRMLRDTWRRDSQVTESQILNRLVGVGLLILDEVGVQFGSDAEKIQLFDIIDKRYRDLMPTMILTNQNVPGLKEFLGERSYDRLRENCIFVKFDWESGRGNASYTATEPA